MLAKRHVRLGERLTNGAPGIEVARGGEGIGGIGARGNLHHRNVVLGEEFMQHRLFGDRAILAGLEAEPAIRVLVLAPRVELSRSGQGGHVELTTGDVGNVAKVGDWRGAGRVGWVTMIGLVLRGRGISVRGNIGLSSGAPKHLTKVTLGGKR